MAEIYGQAVRANNETELYRAIASWLPSLVPADRASVTLAVGDGELEVLGLEGEAGLIPLGRRLPIDSSGPGAAVSSGLTQRWTLAQFGSRFEAAGMRDMGLHAVVNAPLIVHDTPVGALNIARAGEGYDEHHGRMLEDVAGLISVNLERFQALAQTRQQLYSVTRNQRRLELLGQLGRRLSAAVTEDDAFLVLADLASEVLPADRLSMAFTDASAGTFRIASVSQDGAAPAGLNPGDEVPLAGTGVGEIVRTERLRYFPDLAASEHSEHGLLAAAGLGSGMSVPVHAEGKVVAVLNCASTDVDAYDAEDQTAASAIATVVGETLDRIRSRDALAVRDRQLASIVDGSPLLMMTVDPHGVIIQLSEFGASQLGHDVDAVRGQPLSSLYPPDQQAQVTNHLADLAEQPAGTVVVWDAQMVNATGDRRWVRHSGRRLVPDSTLASTILVCEDVTRLLELTEKLEHEATHDSLTGLVNRRDFDRRLSMLIAADSSGQTGSVCYIDIDHFKIVNDTAGHHAGDALLVTLAKTLSNVLQQGDLLARLGGDEFAVLLPHCSLANAVRVAERLRVAANDTVFSWTDKTFGVSLSIGVAAIDPDRPGTDDVIGRADSACYRAKRAGRNNVVAAPTSCSRPASSSQPPSASASSPQSVESDEFFE